MGDSKNFCVPQSRRRLRVLAPAVLSTLAATGLSHAALVPLTHQPYPDPSSVGFVGPVPAQPDTVSPGSKFDVAVVGLDVTNQSNGAGYTANDAGFLIGPFTPTFGVTDTVTKATTDGETATITSSETTTGGITTDKITVSVPTRFVPVGTKFSDGDLINEEDLEVGFDAGTTALTFAAPVTGKITATGSAIYTYQGSKDTYTFAVGGVYTSLNTAKTMLSADEGLSTFTDSTNETAADITQYNFSSFSFTFSYPATAVPEPATGMVALMIGGLIATRRRQRGESSPLVPLSTGVPDDAAPAQTTLAAASVADQSGDTICSIEESRLI